MNKDLSEKKMPEYLSISKNCLIKYLKSKKIHFTIDHDLNFLAIRSILKDTIGIVSLWEGFIPIDNLLPSLKRINQFMMEPIPIEELAQFIALEKLTEL